MWRLWRHRPICLQLVAVNLSEANFTDIEVEVHISGDVRSWPEELDEFRRGEEHLLPEPPPVLGTPVPKSFLPDGTRTLRESLGATNIITGSSHTLTIPSGPSFTVRDDGSVTINFVGVDLRPEQRVPLPVVRLLVDADERTVLDCEWKATAGNVPRRLSGRFALTVGPSTLSFDDLEDDAEPDDAANIDEDEATSEAGPAKS